MKLLFFLLLSFIHPVKAQVVQSAQFNLSTFKNIPDDLTGCGNCYYLSAADKKKGRLLCLDGLDEVLVYINGKATRFKSSNIPSKNNESFYHTKNYTLIIKITYQKQLDDEYYVLKGIITIKANNKTIYTMPVVGDGGC